jgi:hypothetical protein
MIWTKLFWLPPFSNRLNFQLDLLQAVPPFRPSGVDLIDLFGPPLPPPERVVIASVFFFFSTANSHAKARKRGRPHIAPQHSGG